MKKKLVFLMLLTSFFSVSSLSFAQNEENNNYEVVQDIKQAEKTIESNDIDVPNVTVSKENNPSLKKTEFMEPDNLIPLSNSTSEFVYKKEDKTGYVNHETQIGFITSYDEISLLGSFLKIKNGGKYGVMDKQGNLILKPQFKKINLCHSGENEYFEVKINGKYRIYNTSGNLISLNEMLSITDNPAILLVNDLKTEFKAFINSLKTEKKAEPVEIVVPETNIVEVNNEVPNTEKLAVEPVSEKTADVVEIVEKPQIVQKKTFTEKIKDKLTNQSTKVEEMSNNNNAIVVDGKLYYILTENNKIGINDNVGNVVVPPKYDTCDVVKIESLFTQSVFVLSGETGYSVYNKKGEIIVEPVYDKLNIYNHGNIYNFAIEENGGILKKHGKIVGNFDLTPPEYKYTPIKKTDKKVINLVKILLNISK